jgi:hypothetical protein
MRLRAALFALAFFATFQVRADTFRWSFNVSCYLCGPFVNQQGMPVNTGGVPATLFIAAGGTLTTTDTPVNGALTITGITGARTANWYMGQYLLPSETDTITGLIPPDPSNPLGLTTATDNLLYPKGNPFIDHSGFAFTMNCIYCGDYGPSGIVQITGQSPGVYSELGATGVYSGPTSFTLTPAPATPEPSTFVLFGIAGFVAVLCRFTRKMCALKWGMAKA